MDDPFRVRRPQPFRDARRHLDGLTPRHGTSRQSRPQAFTLEQLDDGDWLAVDDGELVDCHDVLMRERRDGARFVLEPRPHFRIAREMSRQDLQRDVAPQTGIVSPIHLSHTAGPDEGLHFILRESSAWSE